MKHPNQSFIDNFFRTGQKNPTNYYLNDIIEKKKKEKFKEFLESIERKNDKTLNEHKYIQELANIFEYNTLSKSKNYGQYIVEEKKGKGSLPANFVYNGLTYSFNEELNVYVNQHGHVISITQATAFMEMASFGEMVDFESFSDADRTIQKISIAENPILIIMLGESNSGGLARNAEAPSNQLGIRSNVNILNNNTLQVETLNIGSTGNNLLGHTGIPDVTSSAWNGACGPPHGWELGIANKFDMNAFGGNTLYILKAGQGGSTIGDWNIGGSYWNTFVNRYNTIRAQIQGNPTIYIWYELGINDCIYSTNINTWRSGLVDHFENVRDTIGVSAPIFMTKLPDVGTAGSPVGGISAFNNVIDGLSAFVPLFYWVKTDDAALLSDQVLVTSGDINHWNYYGMKKISYRMADMTTNLIGMGSTYFANIANPPAQPLFDDESPLWAVVPYSGFPEDIFGPVARRKYLGAGRENIFLGCQMYGRLSANSYYNEYGGGENPESVISYLNLKGVPEAKRLVFAANMGAANAESYWITQGVSYDGCINLGDSVKLTLGGEPLRQTTKDSRAYLRGFAGFSAWGGTFAFLSPWTNSSNQVMNTWWTDWLTNYKTLNGKAFGFLSDNESAIAVNYFSPLMMRWDNYAGQGYDIEDRSAHISAISQDFRFSSIGPLSGNAGILGQSMYTQLKLNQGYTLSDFNVATLYDGTTNGYLLWDYVIGRIANYYAELNFANPVYNKFPNSRATHIRSKYITEADKIPDYNGHKFYHDQVIGGNACDTLFGWIVGAGSVYGVCGADPTTLSYNAGIGTTWGINAWNAFLLNQQRIRSFNRNKNKNERMHLWMANRGMIENNAFGGVSDANRNGLWRENLYHKCMHNPEMILLFYPTNVGDGSSYVDDNETLDIVDSVLSEVNGLTSNKIQSTISIDKLRYDREILVTGCVIKNGTKLWRISANWEKVNTIVVNGTPYSITQALPGIWYSTGSDVTDIIWQNYVAGTQTVYLISLITG